MSSFAQDLAKGNAFEDKVQKKLEKLGYQVRKPDTKAWDLEFKKDDNSLTNWLTIEVKCDYMALITHNVAFETSYKNLPSGINNEGIDFWIHGIGSKKALMIPFLSLKEQLKTAPHIYKEKLGQGSSGILVKVAEFEKFKDIEILDFAA